MRFRYMAALYNFNADQSHIAVPDSAEALLRPMAARLIGSHDLVAIYIPLGAEAAWRPDSKRGRVVGGVRLLPMPEDRSICDYCSPNLNDDSRSRWPIGWPCCAVYDLPVEECPMLRDIVDDVHGPGSFQPYARSLHNGPSQLGFEMANRLDAWFARFPTVSDR